MKMILSATAITVMSTAVFATPSDRYNDLRLDTGAAAETGPAPVLSSNSAGPVPYAYQTTTGVGPNNDSR